IPSPGFFMSSIVARRGPSFSMTTPTYPSGQSIISSSYGSSRSPFGPSRGMIRGRLTWNSYPSRRIVSIRVGRGSLPVRPLPGDDPRPTHLELVPLAPHRLHQNAEVQLPAPRHGERLGIVRLLHSQRHVLLQ